MLTAVLILKTGKITKENIMQTPTLCFHAVGQVYEIEYVKSDFLKIIHKEQCPRRQDGPDVPREDDHHYAVFSPLSYTV